MNRCVNRPIDPFLLAQKMQGIRNFENFALFEEFQRAPRLVEVLWALQFFSQPARPKPRHQGKFIGGYPGGLRAFTYDLINDSLDLIGTETMRTQGADAHYDRAIARAVYNEIPRAERPLCTADEMKMFDAVLGDQRDCGPEYFTDDPPARYWPTSREVESVLKKANRESFLNLCVDAARSSLPDYLRSLCELRHTCFTRDPDADHSWSEGQAPWYFAEIAQALLRFIDRHKQAVYQRVAETEVSREINKWLGRALATSRAVLISGDSRFGKTEAIEAFCEAHPGKARLVETPSSNCESDLLRAISKAIGIEIGPKRRGHQLREEIGYLVEQAGLMLVFDEAQGIFPSSFGRNTPPTRLNWIRRNVLDRGIAAAFVCTPQSYETARKKFLRATNFAIQQWDERLLQTVHLPKELPHEDLIAIARIRFPDLHSDYLEYVVSAVKLSERNYVSDVSRIADLARLNAEESGRKNPNFADIKAAIADVLPASKAVTTSAPECKPALEDPVIRTKRFREITRSARSTPLIGVGN